MTAIQQRRGTAAQWTSVNPVLADAEFGKESDTGQLKIGDGVTPWNDLPYLGSGGESIPAVSTMWWDYEYDSVDPWNWQVPTVFDPGRTVPPITHYAHQGPHPLVFSPGGEDGNSPGYMTPDYPPPEYNSDRGLYHVDGLLMLSTFDGTAAAAGELKVFWNIGVFPTGTEAQEIDYTSWGIEDAIHVSGDGDIITSRVSYDMVLDGDRTFGNVGGTWMSCTNAATRDHVRVMKHILTARRVGSWSAPV